MIGELSTWVMFILFGIGSVVTARKIPPEKKVGIAKYLAHMGVGLIVGGLAMAIATVIVYQQ